MKKSVIAVLIIGIVGGLAILLMNGYGKTSKVVAIVNDDKITSKEFEDFKDQVIKQQGIDLKTWDAETKKQFETAMLDGLISEKVVIQNIEKSGLKIEDLEVDEKLSELKTQIGGDEQFKTLLETQKLTEETLKEKIKNSLLQEKYFSQKIDFSKITVTDEEVKTSFEEFSKDQEMGTLEENKEEIKNYLTQQKRQDLIIGFVEELKKAATIEILK